MGFKGNGKPGTGIFRGCSGIVLIQAAADIGGDAAVQAAISAAEQVNEP